MHKTYCGVHQFTRRAIQEQLDHDEYEYQHNRVVKTKPGLKCDDNKEPER